MNSIKNITPKFLLAMLTIVGMVVFVMPVQNASAQATTQNYCTSPSLSVSMPMKLANSTASCPPDNAQYPGPWTSYSKPIAQRGVCQYTTKTSYIYTDPTILGASGRVVCPDNPGAGTLITFSSMPTYTGTTVKPPTNTGGGIKPKPINTGGTGSTGNTTQVQGDCDPNFHKIGPLCVPNSDFNADSIVGTNTAPGIAVRIIRILLYFAGIVAVIMAIIGGYQVMTAAGNAAQATNGRKTLTNAIIGLVIVILAFLIVQAVISFVTK